MINNILILMPIVITIFISVYKKDVILALYTGVFLGILILASGHILQALAMFFGDFLINEITDSYNAGVIILIVFITGFIAMIEYSRGTQSFAMRITKFLNTKVKTQLAAYLFGVVIFFSDLGTPLIVGPVFSPLFNKMGICREKLAYIIDSTASPMAILIPFTGWGIYIMSLIDDQISSGTITGNSFEIFMHSIAFEFYSVLAIVIVPLVIIFDLDLFKMQEKQEECNRKEILVEVEDEEGQARYIVVPLIVLFSVLTYGLYKMGFPFEPLVGSSFRVVLSSAYFLAAITIIILMALNKHKIFKLYNEYLKGMKKSITMIIILIGAWSLSSVVDALGTTDLIVKVLDGHLPVFLFPALIFIVGTLLSSTTGSSWGTLAILTPFAMAIVPVSGFEPSILMGAVLSGSLFGDHLSPISDTTIFSAQGCSIELLDHVFTQLPYGIINATISLFCFIGVGLYTSYIWMTIALCASVLTLFIIKKIQIGRKYEENVEW